MNPRERVLAALQHRIPDRVPRFEIWIDALWGELGSADPPRAYVDTGQDGILLPSLDLPGSNAWGTGMDEWGRVWRDGIYMGGVLDSAADLERFSPPLDCAEQLFDRQRIAALRRTYPGHCLMFGTHIGPFTAAYLAMGMERFFLRLVDDRPFVQRLLEARTDWCLALYRQAEALGAEVLVLADDAGSGKGPLISPRLWRELVWPCHRRIVDGLHVPVIWHSDGDITSLLPMAIEAGIAGVHGLDPLAGMDLAHIKREYGRDLVLVGNVDVRVLFAEDLGAVRNEVDRCLRDGAPGGGYMLATCNSIHAGMNPSAVRELFRYCGERVAG